MPTAEPRTLEAMHNRPTSYEVVAVCGREQVRLGFTPRRTKGALLAIAQEHAEIIMPMLGDWDGPPTYTAGKGWQFGPVCLRFSGKTERDARRLK